MFIQRWKGGAACTGRGGPGAAIGCWRAVRPAAGSGLRRSSAKRRESLTALPPLLRTQDGREALPAYSASAVAPVAFATDCDCL